MKRHAARAAGAVLMGAGSAVIWPAGVAVMGAGIAIWLGRTLWIAAEEDRKA
jgi:hypothetical protein